MTQQRKQIIRLMTDATRQDMVGCYGNPAMHTPNLDALAAGGIRYQNAYTLSRIHISEPTRQA